MTYLCGKQVKILVGLLKVGFGGIRAQEGKHLGIGSLDQQSDGAVWRSHNDAHAPSLAAELHDIENLEFGLSAEELEGQVLIATSFQLKAQLSSSIHKSNFIW